MQFQPAFRIKSKAVSQSTLSTVLLPEDGGTLTFVTHMGPPSNDSISRSAVKQCVRQQVGRYRRKLGIKRRQPPLQYPLLLPDTPLLGIQSLQLTDYHLTHQQYSKKDEKQAETCVMSAITFEELSLYSANNLESSIKESEILSDFNDYWLNSIEFVKDPQERLVITDRLGAGRFDPFIKFPIEIDQRARELVDTIFDDRPGMVAPFREAWFSIGLLDAGAFHQLLSGAAAYYNSLRTAGTKPESQEIIAHHGYSMQFVNKSLAALKTALSDGTIGSIIGFACYYHLRGDMRKWQIHLDGVKDILRIRGGINVLDTNQFLRIMLSSIDLSGSCTLDKTPNFPFPANLVPCIHYPPSPFLQQTRSFTAGDLSNTWQLHFHGRHFLLMEIMNDMIIETSHLQAEITRSNSIIWHNTIYACHYINPLLHRLLSLPVVRTSEPLSCIAETLRLSAIIYLIAIRQKFGIYPARATSQLHKMRTLLGKSGQEKSVQIRFGDHGLYIIQLWSLALGAMMSSGKKHQHWFLQEFHVAMNDSGLRNYSEVERQLKGFLWLADVHGPLLSMLEKNSVE